MGQNNQQKISMIRYVLMNPKFSSFDKIQFFGYFFLSLIFLFLIGFRVYKVIEENYDISYPLFLAIVVVLIVPLIKYTQYLAKKFTIPYKIFIGQEEKAKEIEESFDRGISILRGEQKNRLKRSQTILIYVLTIIIFIFILWLFLGSKISYIFKIW